ncbi:MAG TPA: group III truncated hemoglobin [Verrucomicrobiae bacterium]|nr:group III truncated hemoglobin [Verrucomicrobiae bacterium]
MLNDIATEADVKLLVDSFYDRVNRDELLSPVFNQIAAVDWEHHLPTMYTFWSSMLFRTGTYKGRPWPKHAPLPVRKEHFERWVSLFCQTIDSHFEGRKAAEAKSVALSIADTFQTRFGIFNPFLFQQATGTKQNELKVTAKGE